MSKRVFKTKSFGRWAKKILAEAALCDAAREIENGFFEADLGGGVCKKRVRIPGRGKSGSTRVLVAVRNELAIIFLAGREKSEPAADFSATEEDAAKQLARAFERAGDAKLDELRSAGVLTEIC